MASSNTAWGIEIGQHAIKAIQLERDGDSVRVRDFVVIPHLQVLTTPGLESGGDDGAAAGASNILEMSLSQLATQKQLAGQNIVVNYSWGGNRGFARFAKLPPVGPKEIPNIVKFEAGQQIPFPLEDVEWDYHTFESEDSPEVEVGIFAIQQEPLKEFLSLVSEKLGIEPRAVTLGPIALYNALAFDRDIASQSEPFVFLDIGTASTDLVVAHGTRCWMRSFPLGGHNFTEAIAESFQLSYRKADALKQESATSKYAKQIMQAMRPVFGDLLGDVQKSLTFYEGQNRGVKLKNVVGMGSTLKIPGLRKFLGMQLGLEVERLDRFAKLAVEGPEAADFASHTVNFATAYGLALQGLGKATIDVNLLPLASMRQQVWSRKTRWFAAAAAIACASGGLMFARGIMDRGALGSVEQLNASKAVLASAKGQQERLSGQSADVGSLSKNVLGLLEDREVWPFILHDAASAIRAANDDAMVGDDLSKLVAGGPRTQTVLRDLSGAYKLDGGSRTIEITMNVEFMAEDSNAHLDETVCRWLESNAKRDAAPYEIVKVSGNNNALTAMKVGADGALASASGSSSSAGGAAAGAAAGGDEDKPFESFTSGGGGGAGSSFGGVTGKRQPSGSTQISRPGGLLGGAGSGGAGFTAGGDAGDPAYGPRDGGSGGFQRGSQQQSESKVDLEKTAPLPARPSLYPPDSTVYVGKVTFVVKLKGEVQSAAPAAEGM
ncbi:MAG: pilus assembly protein PilM [Planctomycetota bacterium]